MHLISMSGLLNTDLLEFIWRLFMVLHSSYVFPMMINEKYSSRQLCVAVFLITAVHNAKLNSLNSPVGPVNQNGLKKI